MSRCRRPRICLFAGPSLSVVDIHSAFAGTDADVQVLPPVQQGDILRLINDLPDVIGIIDGYFFHVPSVLHREILLALARGARVLGSSSIGALRAAELDLFGMEGIGEIYCLYRRGVIDGDDEVAVLHATQDDGFRALTEALLNIRHNLSRARRHGIISSKTAATALACAKRLHFMRRTHEAILRAVTRQERPALDRFLHREAVDLKREDALRLVRTIVARLDGSKRWPSRMPLEVQQTSLFNQYQREYVGQWIGGRHIPDDRAMAFQRLLSRSFSALYRRVSLRCLALDQAAHCGLVPNSSAALVATFRHSRRIQSDSAYHAWLRRRLMSHDELLEFLRERDLEKQILDLYRSRYPAVLGRAALLRRIARDVAGRYGTREAALTRPLLMHPGVPWTGPVIREVKVQGAFAEAVDLADRILRHNSSVFERFPQFTRAPIRRGLLNEFFVKRWGVEPERLDTSILQRGFTGYSEFVGAARDVYVYEKTRLMRSVQEWESISTCFVQL